MELQEIDTLRALLPAGRTVYSYFKDKYSLQLLRYAVRRPTPVAELRRQPVARLLEKPAVREVLARCGGQLAPAQLELACGHPSPQHYTLSLGVWGGERTHAPQTSRPGANLVLQLNFSQEHNQAFQRLVRPRPGGDPFNYFGHPALRDERENRRYTLAWARLDLDLEHGEALIEELQSDWLRAAARVGESARQLGEEQFRRRHQYRFQGGRQAVLQYCEQVLPAHQGLWDEALLAAVLFFLREELGLARIWMHTPRSGVLLKNIRYGAPPTSLYSSLPQRFCFIPGASAPAFLTRNRRAARYLRREPGLCLQQFCL